MTDQTKGQRFLEELCTIKQELPFSPSLLGDLFSMTGEESFASLEKVAQTFNQDQGLSAKVLTLANSAFYGLQAKVTSVSRAVALLGLKEIRNLVLLMATQALTVRHHYPRAFDIRGYWDHQLGVGVCAKLLAQRLQDADPDILFTAGLLHDLGVLLTALYRPDDWAHMHRTVLAEGCSWREAEERYWGLEHGLIGAMTLNSWNLPPELTEPINWHHAPELAPEHKREAWIICLADGLYHRHKDEAYALSSSATQALELFGFHEESILNELAEMLEEDSMNQLVAQLT